MPKIRAVFSFIVSLLQAESGGCRSFGIRGQNCPDDDPSSNRDGSYLTGLPCRTGLWGRQRQCPVIEEMRDDVRKGVAPFREHASGIGLPGLKNVLRGRFETETVEELHVGLRLGHPDAIRCAGGLAAVANQAVGYARPIRPFGALQCRLNCRGVLLPAGLKGVVVIESERNAGRTSVSPGPCSRLGAGQAVFDVADLNGGEHSLVRRIKIRDILRERLQGIERTGCEPALL